MELKDYVISLRRHFHENPELSMQEYETKSYIEKELDDMGISHYSLGKTDVIAEIYPPGAVSKEFILLRADIDALPIEECTSLPYASCRPGIMHACGHDAHTAMLLGAAKLLAGRKNRLAFPVKLVFQPAEETGQATPSLLENGLLNQTATAFAIHVSPDMPCHTVSVSPGPCMAGVSDFAITLSSFGGHGALPHLGKDALLAGAHLAVNLQTIVSREMNPLDPVVVTIGIFESGTKVNVLASQAVLKGNVRFFKKELSPQIESALKRISSHTADMFGCKAEVFYTPSLEPVINHEKSCQTATQALRELPELQLTAKEPYSTSEDFSRYLAFVPGALAFLGTSDGTAKTSYPLHHNCFDLAEDALIQGSLLYAHYAFNWKA